MTLNHFTSQKIVVFILILGVCILLCVWDPGGGGFITSMQRYYRR
jgi:hypothetical protein